MVTLDSLTKTKPDLIAPSSITRLLVVSYFIALALNLVEGADVKLLATPFVSDDVAQHLMRFVVLLLSAMVLFGIQRKAAALILALVVFWPSYMTLHADSDVSAFWRDLALTGALVMSAYERVSAAKEPVDDHGIEDHTLELKVEQPDPPSKGDQPYRKDLNLARSA